MTIKDEIIQKSLNLFASEGYENTSIQRIVDELAITKPTLYHYFGSKEGLLRSLLESYGRAFINQLIDQVSYNQDIIYTIEHLALFYIQQAKKQPIYYRLSKNLRYSPLESESYRVVTTYYLQELDIIKGLFDRIALHHTGLKGKSTILAYTFLGHIDAYVTYHIEEDTLNRLTDDESRRLAKQFLYGIFS